MEMNELLVALMTLKKKTIHPLKPRTCQVLEDEALARASATQSITYIECDACGGRIEVWNDEDTSVCLDCGEEWQRVKG